MPNSLNTRLLRITNEEENWEVRTQIRPREYDYSISYVDNFGGFVPYHNTSNTSDVRISYDYIPHGTTLSNGILEYGTRLENQNSTNFESFKCLDALKDLQKFYLDVCFKYNKKSKVFYNKI